jgi:putative transposase
VENAFIESFNGRLRDECLNSHVFATVADVRRVLDSWRADCNAVRPHSAPGDRTSAEAAAMWRSSREACESNALNRTGIELEITAGSITFQM